MNICSISDTRLIDFFNLNKLTYLFIFRKLSSKNDSYKTAGFFCDDLCLFTLFGPERFLK